jgi:sulfonate transport system substrate-binding protein
MALRTAGLSMTDITPVFLTPPDGAIAFAGGQIDAWTIWDALYAISEAKQGARVLTTAHGVIPANLFLIANRKFAETYPKLLHETHTELEHVITFINQHKDEVAEAFAKTTGVPLGIEKIITDRATFAISPMTDTIIAQQQFVADTFNTLGLLPKPVTIRDAVWIVPRS